MTSKTRIGIGIVGTGMAAKPHALALGDLADRVEVRGAYARSAERRNAFAATYGFPVAESAEELAADPNVDALLLITPPNARRELVSLFANAGKHVLCEKPLERTTESAQAIVRTCGDAGVKLGVVFQHRFRAASQKLAAMLSSGDLGAIRVVRADVPWWRDQTYYDESGRGTYARDGGGVLISQAIHTLDLMLSLTGPVASVQALCATTPFHRMEAEDFAAGAMMFENGAVGVLHASTASFPGDAESLTFECDHASVLVKSGVLTLRWRDGRTESHGEEAGTGGGADPMAFPYEWHKSLIADFADAIADDRPPRVTGADALHVHRLITALETSSREGRRVDLSGAQT
ncbi:Gfo/Idh/MocA family protein [Oricola sp.]|uniref:Gfo/Idh/MocA family protein n=1 Tax=Oricola sp. TaxID=1979950 RepID=UPI003BAAF6E8